MALEVFIPRDFRGPARKMIGQANAIIAEYQSQGLVITIRQLHYQFVSRDLYANTQDNYELLGRTMTHARNAGVVDWDAIEDRTRDMVFPQSWDSPAEIIASAASSYREDLWLGQGHRVMVLIEKEALFGVIEGICDQYRVPVMAAKGNNSTTEVFKAGKLLGDQIADDLMPIALYLGDHDPSGMMMSEDMTRRLSRYARDQIELRRIALNIEQVRHYRPPSNFAKEKDANFAAYKARFGTNECWELDALAPNVIADLIKAEIESLIDPKPWKVALVKEAKSKSQLAAVADGMT